MADKYRVHEMSYAEIGTIIAGLESERDRLRAELENLRADNQTQGAFLREGYRFKTGETHA